MICGHLSHVEAATYLDGHGRCNIKHFMTKILYSSTHNITHGSNRDHAFNDQ